MRRRDALKGMLAALVAPAVSLLDNRPSLAQQYDEKYSKQPPAKNGGGAGPDIRKILSDNAIKDMLAEEDGKFIRAVNDCLEGRDAERVNKAIFDKLSSGDPLAEKEAVDAINDFTRVQMREEGFFRKIMPPERVTSPSFSVDKSPPSPAAISLPFKRRLPTAKVIKGKPYKIYFRPNQHRTR